MTEVDLPDWMTAARSCGIVSRLSDALVAELIRGANRVMYPPGSTLIAWDAEPAGMMVLQGSVRVYLSAPDGSQVTLRYMRPGDMIGAFSRTEDVPVRNLETVDQAELLHLDVGKVAALTRSQPALAWEMVNELTRVLRMTHRSYGIRAWGSIRVRVAHAILERAKARGGVRSGTLVSGTQAELAVAAGTVREVVAGALKDMRNDGILEIRRGGVVILDATQLRREAGALGFGLAADSA